MSRKTTNKRPFGATFGLQPEVTQFEAPENPTEADEMDAVFAEAQTSPAEQSRWRAAFSAAKGLLTKENIGGAATLGLGLALGARDGQGPEAAVAGLTGYMEGLDIASKEASAALRERETLYRQTLDRVQPNVPIEGHTAIMQEIAGAGGVDPSLVGDPSAALRQREDAAARQKAADVAMGQAKLLFNSNLDGERAIGYEAVASVLELSGAPAEYVQFFDRAAEYVGTSTEKESQILTMAGQAIANGSTPGQVVRGLGEIVESVGGTEGLNKLLVGFQKEAQDQAFARERDATRPESERPVSFVLADAVVATRDGTATPFQEALVDIKTGDVKGKTPEQIRKFVAKAVELQAQTIAARVNLRTNPNPDIIGMYREAFDQVMKGLAGDTNGGVLGKLSFDSVMFDIEIKDPYAGLDN